MRPAWAPGPLYTPARVRSLDGSNPVLQNQDLVGQEHLRRTRLRNASSGPIKPGLSPAILSLTSSFPERQK